jgi:hypothetical protein
MNCANYNYNTSGCSCVEGNKYDLPSGYSKETGFCINQGDFDCDNFEFEEEDEDDCEWCEEGSCVDCPNF